MQHIFEKDVHYKVPLYQRPYVWNEADQWVPLWEDLSSVAEVIEQGGSPRAHFLGASVQDKPDLPPGSIETRLLIDGQQRLTTLQLLIKAFEHVVSAMEADSFRKALRKLVSNDHPLCTEPSEAFKIWPTNADRDDYESVMSSFDNAEARANLEMASNRKRVGRTIPDAYLFFFEVISGWVEEADGDARDRRIAALYSAIRDNVRLVVIDLDDKDDAQMIFETLNARGTPLLAADLVKNSLLSELESNCENAEAAYNKHWQAFDQDGAFWRQEIGRGHARRARLELFLRHVLSLMTGRNVSAAHLYTAYRELASGPDAPDALERMVSIHKYGVIYKRLQQGVDDPEISRHLERIGVMDLETIYPLLLVLFDRLKNDREGLLASIRALDSFLVRRMVCRLSTRSYGTFFLEVADEVNGPNDVVALLIARLEKGTAEVDRWPTDTEFEKAWLGNALYENLRRPRLRMLLEEMERASRTKYAEHTHVPSNLTVEHIMPQAWQAHWPLPGIANEMEEAGDRDRLVQTIGNLTLLNDKLNPAQSNNAWVSEDGHGKRAGLERHSVLYLNKALLGQDSWTEASIIERGKSLLHLALSIWPR